MAKIIKAKEVDISHKQTRRGFADQKRVGQVNIKEELFLKKDLVMRNRASDVTDSDNVFELYILQDPGTKENYMFIGRSGRLTEARNRNVSYLELTANMDTTKKLDSGSDAAIRNGRIVFALSHDKANPDTPNLDILDSSAFTGGAKGSVAVYIAGRGTSGLSGIGNQSGANVNVTFYNLGSLLYLGATLQPDASNAYDIGTGSLRIKTIYTINAVDVSSDIRFKKRIKKLPYGLKEILKINPIAYERDGKKHLGFSAQELRKILPEIVGGKEDKAGLSIRPDEIVPVLLNAIKELSIKVDRLTRKTAGSCVSSVAPSKRRILKNQDKRKGRYKQ